MSATSSRGGDEESTTSLVSRGTTTFAAVMLITVAAFQIIEGIAAIAEDSIFVIGVKYTYEFDVTAWGWIHLILGIIAAATGFGILAGQAWGLLVGTVIACISALSSFAFMPYYPFWSIAVIAFNVFVIWALCAELNRT
jgi:hypothetical protein